MHRALAILLLIASLERPAAADGRDAIVGPVPVSVVRVIDGDTVEVDAHVWPGHTVRVAVRLRGIDAPELRSRCEAEKRMAREAQAALQGLLVDGHASVRNVDADKYFGRVVADLVTADGRRVTQSLLEASLVAAYDGGARRAWC